MGVNTSFKAVFIVLLFCLILASVKGQCLTLKPNILLFVGDDMSWVDCSPYGNTDVRTPNIQGLADEGMCFDNMFTGTAMCAPSRQQIYSGMNGVRSGAYPNHSIMHDGAKSFATYFSEMGYRVGLIGKKHYGPEASFPLHYFGGLHHDGGQGLDIDLGKIEDFMTNKNESPYFMVIAQNQPHMPWTRGQRKPYNANELKVPEYLIDSEMTRREMVKYYAEITYMDSLLGVCLNYVEQSGCANNTLVIFTSEQGSNFPFAKWTCYDMGLKNAFIMKYPGVIVPGTRNSQLLQTVDVLPTLLELVGANPNEFDTGIPDAYGNRGFDGTSFAGLLNGKDDMHPRKYVYGVQTTRGIYHGPEAYAIRSVRDLNYKLIWNIHHDTVFSNLVTVNKKWLLPDWEKAAATPAEKARVALYSKRPEFELYDINMDPYEMNNLAGNMKYAKVIDELFSQLKIWMKQQGDFGHETEMKALERQDKEG